jgi:hypothetical protein
MFKKVLFVFLITIIFTAGAMAQIAKDGLISFWTFDDKTVSGKTIKDLIGKNDGTMIGNAKISEGKINQALELDGSGSYVNISQPQVFPKGNETYAIEAWFYTNIMKVEGIIGWGTWGTGNQVNALRLGTDVNGFRHYWWGNDLDIATGDISQAWHHVIAQYDGKTRSIWLDGKMIKSDTPAGHNAQISDVNIGVTNNRSEFWNGKLDEMRLYNRGLTEEEILKNYKVESNVMAVKSSGKLEIYWGMIKKDYRTMGLYE